MIKELVSESEWFCALPVLQELRPHLNESNYLDFLKPMTENGYRMFALFDGEEIVSVAGIAICTNFYNGKHVFVYDLVTKSTERSKGYGKELLEYIHRFARENGCSMVSLESALFRTEAHRFYETKLGYEKKSYSFRKTLNDPE
jgi:GNAT superfamily N-acetyltransferase